MLWLKIADDDVTIIFSLRSGDSASAPMVIYKSGWECWPCIATAFSKLLFTTSVVNSDD